MYWRDIGYLVSETGAVDSLRKPYKILTEREVFCNEKGVKRNEFYQAQANGYRPELCVEIKACDYNKERYFKFDNIMYRIMRTYPVKGENLEIICTALVSENG